MQQKTLSIFVLYCIVYWEIAGRRNLQLAYLLITHACDCDIRLRVLPVRPVQTDCKNRIDPYRNRQEFGALLTEPTESVGHGTV